MEVIVLLLGPRWPGSCWWCSRLRDAGGADAVAVRDRRQALHVGADDPADGLGLGLAQLRELVGHVGHRAVLLAQLLAHHRELPEAGGVATLGEHLGERLGGAQVGLLRHQPRAVALDEGHPAAGELHDGLVPTGLGEEAQRGDREVVVLLVEGVAARLGQREDLRRPAAPAGAVDPALARLDGALRDQVVEVATDRRGGQGQPRGEVGGAWTVRSRGSTGPPARAWVRLRPLEIGAGNSTTPVCR